MAVPKCWRLIPFVSCTILVSLLSAYPCWAQSWLCATVYPPKLALSFVSFASAPPPGHQNLDQEFVRINERLQGLETANESTTTANQTLRDKIDRLSRKLDGLSKDLAYQEELVKTRDSSGSTSLMLVTVVIALLGLALTVVINIGFKSLHSSMKELQSSQEALDRKTQKAQMELEEKIKSAERIHAELRQRTREFKNSIAEQGKRFAEETASHEVTVNKAMSLSAALTRTFFADAMLELLRALERGAALTPKASEKLRTKAKEVEARIFLRHNNLERIEQAVQTLTGLGTRDSIPDLSELASQDDTPKELRESIHMAIARISERHPTNPPDGTREAATSVTPPGDLEPAPQEPRSPKRKRPPKPTPES